MLEERADKQDEEDQETIRPYNPLEYPAENWNRVFYVVLFPVNLSFFFVFPNIADPLSTTKVTIMLLMVLACSISLVYLLLMIEYDLLDAYAWLNEKHLALFNALVFVSM